MDYPKDDSSAQDQKPTVAGVGDGNKLDQPKEEDQSLVFSKDETSTGIVEEEPIEIGLKTEPEVLKVEDSSAVKEEEVVVDPVAVLEKPVSIKYPKLENQVVEKEKVDSQEIISPPEPSENSVSEPVDLNVASEIPILDVSDGFENKASQELTETDDSEAKERTFPVLEVSEDSDNKDSQEEPKPISLESASQEPSLTDVLKESPEDVSQDPPKNDFESSYEPKDDGSKEYPSAIKTDLADLSLDPKSEEERTPEEDIAGEDKEKLGPKPMAGMEAVELPKKEFELSEDGSGSSPLEPASVEEPVAPGFDSQVSPVGVPKTSSFIADKAATGFKKILPIALILLFVSLIGFSVFKFVLPMIKKEAKAELVYWGLWESEGVINQVIADFNKEYPDVKVKYVMQSKQEYRERLQSSLARGEGPDIFRFHAAWVPMLKNQLDKVPESVLSASQYQSTYYPVASTQLKSGSSYLGIPLEVDTLGLFYNKEIFQMAGKTPPKTWEELRSTAMELTVRDSSGRIQTAGVAIGNTTNIEHWSDILGLMMVQNGVDLNSPSKCSTFENEEICLGVDALKFYTLFNKVDQVWDNSMPNSTESFASGKLAMYFGYSWDVFEIQARNKNLNFGIVEAPQLSGEKVSWASFWVEGVNNKSNFKEEAWQFMEFLNKKETLEKLYSLSSNTRAFGEPYARVDMRNMLSSNPLVSPFVNQASYAKTWYLCSRTYDNGINDKMIDYFKDAVNAVNLNKDPKQALQTASMGVSQLLSQYGLGSYTVR